MGDRKIRNPIFLSYIFLSGRRRKMYSEISYASQSGMKRPFHLLFQSSQPAGVLASWRALDSAVDIDRERFDRANRFNDVFWRQPAGQKNPGQFRRLARNLPVSRPSCAAIQLRVEGVEQDRRSRIVENALRFEIIAYAEGFDH